MWKKKLNQERHQEIKLITYKIIVKGEERGQNIDVRRYCHKLVQLRPQSGQFFGWIIFFNNELDGIRDNCV